MFTLITICFWFVPLSARLFRAVEITAGRCYFLPAPALDNERRDAPFVAFVTYDVRVIPDLVGCRLALPI
jgi:hypothetical protein